MKRKLALFTTSVALTLAVAAQSHADPFQYSYTWTASPVSIPAGIGSVSFTTNDGGVAAVQTDAAATHVSVFSADTSTNPDVIPVPASGSNYTLAVTVSDNLFSGDSGTISFTGLLQGQLTHNSSNLTNIITGVTDQTGAHAGQTFGVLILGGSSDAPAERYVVSYNGFAVPGPEAQNNQWAVAFHISPSLDFVEHTPEPSSMVLGCLGLTFFGGAVYRARRRLLNAVV